jgi:cyclopropane fatty-acyl-phospholipid synthase-like methyltransferase
MEYDDVRKQYRQLNDVCPDVLTFFNHGYSSDNNLYGLDSDYFNGYQKSLYHHLLSNLVTENKNILDIGCGRGG